MHKLDKGVFAEYKSDILDKEKTSKGAWMDANLSLLDLAKAISCSGCWWAAKCMSSWCAQDRAGRETVFRPQPIRRNRAVILARDGDGHITSIGTAEETASGGKYTPR
ncbi:MAG: hypothetical protein ACLRI7_14345 [Ruthenibacterium lactatiformans]